MSFVYIKIILLESFIGKCLWGFCIFRCYIEILGEKIRLNCDYVFLDINRNYYK